VDLRHETAVGGENFVAVRAGRNAQQLARTINVRGTAHFWGKPAPEQKGYPGDQ
jgi:hypothetical protein